LAIAYPCRTLAWRPAWRVVPTRYPAINLFDRVADPADFEALYALEALTNDRLRDEVGHIQLVPPDERRYGPGSGPIMAAFTHLNPAGSRFSDGSYGVFYCGRDKLTAIHETRYHQARFLAATAERPMRLAMRLYSVSARGEAVDLIDACRNDPALIDPDRYAAAQAVGRTLREAGAAGCVYPSVRHPGGECLAAFKTTLLRDCLHSAYLDYQWDGEKISAVFEMNQLL
jgi:hypothetical protein